MSHKQRCALIQANRIFIFVLSLIGLSMDGFEVPDLMLTAAIAVWLWLPQCTRIEAQIMEHIDHKGVLFGPRARR